MIEKIAKRRLEIDEWSKSNACDKAILLYDTRKKRHNPIEEFGSQYGRYYEGVKYYYLLIRNIIVLVWSINKFFFNLNFSSYLIFFYFC